jgi:hypothetical protein
MMFSMRNKPLINKSIGTYCILSIILFHLVGFLKKYIRKQIGKNTTDAGKG